MRWLGDLSKNLTFGIAGCLSMFLGLSIIAGVLALVFWGILWFITLANPGMTAPGDGPWPRIR